MSDVSQLVGSSRACLSGPYAPPACTELAAGVHMSPLNEAFVRPERKNAVIQGHGRQTKYDLEYFWWFQRNHSKNYQFLAGEPF
jgi:hypothetical protein